MAWIELHQSVFTHRKTLELAALLDLPEVYVVGHLTALWCWALDNAQDGVLRCSERIIGKIAQWPGKSEDFVSALVECGWLTRTEDGLRIHDWMEYAGKLIERREKDAARKRESRQLQDIPQKSEGHPTDGEKTAYVPNQTRPDQTVPNPTEQTDRVESPSSVTEKVRFIAQTLADNPHWEPFLVEQIAKSNPAPSKLTGFKASVLRNWLDGDGTPPFPGSSPPPNSAAPPSRPVHPLAGLPIEEQNRIARETLERRMREDDEFFKAQQVKH